MCPAPGFLQDLTLHIWLFSFHCRRLTQHPHQDYTLGSEGNRQMTTQHPTWMSGKDIIATRAEHQYCHPWTPLLLPLKIIWNQVLAARGRDRGSIKPSGFQRKRQTINKKENIAPKIQEGIFFFNVLEKIFLNHVLWFFIEVQENMESINQKIKRAASWLREEYKSINKRGLNVVLLSRLQKRN